MKEGRTEEGEDEGGKNEGIHERREE